MDTKGYRFIKEKVFLLIWGFYLIVYTLFSASEICYMYDVQNVKRVAWYIVIISLALLFVFRTKYTVKQVGMYLLFLFLITIIEYHIYDLSFLITILFILNSQGVDFRRFIKTDIRIKIILTLFIMLLCALGIIDNYAGTVRGVYKQALGFANPNTFCCYILTISLEILFLRFEKMKVIEWCIHVVLFLAVFFIGGGRTSCYAYGMIFVACIFLKAHRNVMLSKAIRAIIILLPAFFTFLSFYVTKIYIEGNLLAEKINEIMTGRVYWCARFLKKYDLGLIGQRIQIVNSRNAIKMGVPAAGLDNAYIRCALEYGVGFLLVLCFFYIISLHKFLLNMDIMGVMFCLFFVLIGLAESYMLNIIYNVTLLCLFNKTFYTTEYVGNRMHG